MLILKHDKSFVTYEMHSRASINGQPPISVTVAKLRRAELEKKRNTCQIGSVLHLDQLSFLGTCPPTPPLNQH